MKKNILKITFAAALAVVAGVMAYQAQDKEVMSDLALANVEALAMIEDPMEEGGYSSMHIRCFDKYGNSTGKCTAAYIIPMVVHIAVVKSSCLDEIFL